MTTILRSPALWRARRFARVYADTHLERPIARALNVGRAVRRDQAAVLYFGDSSLIHIAHDDVDRRRLGEMLADEVGLPTAQFYGPGYSAELFAQIARLLQSGHRPRCVVLSLCIRTNSHEHVRTHPLFGYRRAAANLRSATAIDARLLRHLYKSRPGELDYRRFDETPHRSVWDRAVSNGEYRRLLRGYDPATAPVDQQRTLYDYFHGEYSQGSPGLVHVRELGENLRRLGVPVVAYRTYMPVSRGVELLGSEFADHVERNFAEVERHFVEGIGESCIVTIEPPPDTHFIATTDGTEHLNQTGRQAMVKTLAQAVQERLG